MANPKRPRRTSPTPLPAEVVRLSQEVVQLMTQRRWAAAAAAYAALAEHASAAEDVAAQALAHYGRAGVLFKLPERRDETRDAFEQAAHLATTVGHRSVAAKAHHALAALALERQDVAGATAHQTQALEHLDDAQETELAIQIYRSRATLYWAALSFNRARVDLARARSLTQLLEPKKGAALRREIQAEEALVAEFLREGRTPAQRLGALRRLAQRSGMTGATEAALDAALAAHEREDFPTVAEQAETARQRALASTHPLRTMHYLTAAVLVAGARERLDDRPGAIASLLTCKATLERELGKEAGEPLTLILNDMAQRWGQAGIDGAMKAYRERVRAAQAS